jgi:polar amino acid transport system substrate-binding protein
MTTTIKKSSVLSVAAAVMLSLSGCGGSDTSNAVSPDCKPKHADVKTVESGKLTVGVIDYPPFSNYNDGKAEGVDISIIKKVAAADCLELVYRPATYADAITSIGQGNLDLATGSIAVTEHRMKVVDFSSSIYVEAMGITTKTGAKTIEEVKSMDGKVGTVDGYLTNPDLKKVFGDRLISYPSTVELKADFDAGRLIADFETYAVAQQQDGTIGKLLEEVGLSADLAKVSAEQYVVPAN